MICLSGTKFGSTFIFGVIQRFIFTRLMFHKSKDGGNMSRAEELLYFSVYHLTFNIQPKFLILRLPIGPIPYTFMNL